MISAAGSATRMFVRNLSFISTPCVFVAAIVGFIAISILSAVFKVSSGLGGA